MITYPPGILESPKKTHRHKNRSSKSSINSISRSIISSPAPDSFRHVAHVGVNANGVFEASKSLDDSWKEMLTKLQGHGVSEAVVIKHHDFVDGFWKGVEAIQGTESSKTERFDGKPLSFRCA
jgi:neural Wiskott-Aldrich syndrome protein